MVTGNTSPRLRPLNLPSVDMSDVSITNDNSSLPQIQKGNNFVDILDGSRNFTLDGGRSYTIPTGDYYFNDLTLTGSSTLNVDPGVNIYLTGKLNTSGGDLINSSCGVQAGGVTADEDGNQLTLKIPLTLAPDDREKAVYVLGVDSSGEMSRWRRLAAVVP